MYYDRAGTEICEQCWKAYWAEDEYRMLARTDIGEWTVAAWWAGVDDGGNGTPRIFRTGLLVPPRQGGYASPLLQEWHHASVEQAMTHHDALVARFRGDDDVPAPVPSRAGAGAPSCH